MQSKTREIHLVRRPKGLPVGDDFSMVYRDIRPLEDGEVLVRNEFLTVDPYMRPRMDDVKSYIPPYQLGRALEGAAVGEVIDSNDENVPKGTRVYHGLGWREHSIVASSALRVIQNSALPLSYHLGILGMPGLTAYVGLFDIARYRRGDSVFVSGAAGAVGSLVAQFARLEGASRVVGTAGSPEKLGFLLDDLGLDAAINYRDGDLTTQLAQAAPDGIDVYFDNVGGAHLAAALEVMNDHGRVTLCGSISGYNETGNQVMPGNMSRAVSKRLTMRGFIVSEHEEHRPEFECKVSQWLDSGELVYRETLVDGLENMVEGFRGLLRGANTGKMIIRL